MSGGFRVRSMNSPKSEERTVLIPAGNTVRTTLEPKKPIITTNKPQKKLEKSPDKPTLSPPMRNLSAPSSLRHGSQLIRGNSSCSSEASSDSSNSRASTGRISSRSGSVGSVMRKQGVSKLDRVAFNSKVEKFGVNNGDCDNVDGNEVDEFFMKKRCAWVTPSTEDSSYVSFHDEEWGIPVHDDNKLFELFSFSVALAELTWPTILNKRSTFKEVFLDFDPVAISKLNEKKICRPGSLGSSLLSELKLRNIFENACQVCKIKSEYGSFDQYIWGFMNQKPIVNKFRYGRQVPVKTSKAEAISKDLVRRGFRGVGPTVVYSFMQAAGLTNDHLGTCFRFQECIESTEKDSQARATVELEKPIELIGPLDEICISSD